MELEQKRQQLLAYMNQCAETDVALAFSGGVDSSLLLKIASDCAEQKGTRVIAVTFQTRLHPPCDMEAAVQTAREMGAEHVVLPVDELEMEEIRQNPENRCYLCKKNLFGRLKAFADERGIPCLMDGTNEDDLHVYRPGRRALEEYGVQSPLARCGVTKQEVRELAAAYGISAASRPSTPCMATRLPYGSWLSYELLDRIAEGEEWLTQMLDYAQANIRLMDERLKERMPKIKAVLPEASFLIFLDCRELGFATQAELESFFVNEARLGLNNGSMFGEEGTGFMRLNVAAPRSVVEQALQQLEDAYARL